MILFVCIDEISKNEGRPHMSIFSKNKEKKNIINSAVVDLRNYTADALDNIKIINAATVLISANPEPDMIEAYSNIKVKNIANEVSVNADVTVSEFSGITVLDKNNYSQDTIFLTSGIILVKKCDAEESVKLITSGVTLYEKGAKVNFISTSGISHELDFEAEHTKTYAHNTEFDNRFIELLEDNTVILCGGSISFAEDVEEQTLLSKNIHFAAGQSITCSKKIKSAVQMKSTLGRKLSVYEK